MEENIQNLNQPSDNLQGPTLQGPNPPQYTSNPIKPASRFSIKVIIAIIIVLILAGGAAASFTVFKPQIIKLVSKPTPMPTIIKSPTPTPISSEKIINQEKLGDVYWNVKDESKYPADTIAGIKDAFSHYPIPEEILKYDEQLEIISVSVSTISADMAIASGDAIKSNGTHLSTGIMIFLLQKNLNKWTIYDTNSEDFCKVLKTFPADFQTAKDYYIGCN